MTNEQKAQEISLQWWSECGWQLQAAAYDSAIEAMQWKDKQFETAINEIKANIIESRDNKEYYETNRKTTLNWILRLIDECCESISIQKENKL